PMDRQRCYDANHVDLTQSRTGHTKHIRALVESRCISFLFLSEPLFPLFFGQSGTLAPVLSLVEILRKPPIALGHLLLAEFVTILFLLQHKQQIFLPAALQTPCNLLLTRLHPKITKRSQLTRIAFACQNGLDDRLPGHSADVAQHVRQLDIHLHQRLLDPSGCDVLPPARDHCVAASTFASCGSPAAAGTNCATAHSCAASSAIDSPARRFSVPADSSSPA